MNTSGDIWVFGYGSLMWKPGFEYIEKIQARLNGFHRDLCILSYLYRGTKECPGLVMGLNKGGHCIGRAFLVSAKNREPVMDYLYEREMPNMVYKPQWVDLTLEDGRAVQAYTFVADEDHDQHVGDRSLEEKVKILLQGRGSGGTALEYLESTVDQLRKWDLVDPNLEDMLKRAYDVQF